MKEIGHGGRVIPLRSKDEMNLVEIPYGPVTPATGEKTLRVTHTVYDKLLKREVDRETTILGSDEYGLPRPIDDLILVGLCALTYEAGYESRSVRFSLYHLCRTIGWAPSGRSYKRLVESLNRIAATTLIFSDAWYDKGDKAWKSKTFHILDEVALTNRAELDRARIRTGRKSHWLCSVEWSKTVFKSFQDGFIRTLDMEMFRRITAGRRKEVPLRLFRILDKRFHDGSFVRLELEKLAVGIIGLRPSYPSELKRMIARAADWLVECHYLDSYRLEENRGKCNVAFRKRTKASRTRTAPKTDIGKIEASPTPDAYELWAAQRSDDELAEYETRALEEGFGSVLEQGRVRDGQNQNRPVRESPLRVHYLMRYTESLKKLAS
jgi:hypothetical protein